MRYAIHEQTLDELRRAASVYEACAVSFSGGKDSLACLDLCLRTFREVRPFFLYFVPGIRCAEEPVERYAARFGVRVRYFRHWIYYQCRQNEVYCDIHWRVRQAPAIGPRDVLDLVRAELGVRLIVSGVKAADGPMRRRRIFGATARDDTGMLYPLKQWLKQDVVAYLKMRGIEPPDAPRKVSFGVDLSTPSLLYLHDHHPEDFRRIEEQFPYVRAAVERRRLYGIQ